MENSENSENKEEVGDPSKLTLGEELRQLMANFKSNDYLEWRKKTLTPEFYESLKNAAEKGLKCLTVRIDKDARKHWLKWAEDHDLRIHSNKVWWCIHG